MYTNPDKSLLDFRNLKEAIRAGDRKALEELYKTSFPQVREYIRKNSGNEEHAKDIFQDAMHVLLKKIYNDTLEEDINLKGYLNGICRNLWLKKLRDEPRALEFEADHHGFIAEDDLYEKEHGKIMEELLFKYLEQTGQKCKAILLSFYFQKLSIKQIAEKFNYKTEGAAKNRKYACLQTLIMLAKEKISVYRS